ncbi:MAG: ribonuclease Y [Bacteroidota bacterium]
MSSFTVLLLVIDAVIALTVGVFVGRWLKGQALAQRMGESKARAERVRTEGEALKVESTAKLKELKARRRRLDQKTAEVRERQRLEQEALDAQRAQLDMRGERVGEHEAALGQATEALAALTQEAEQRRAETEDLRATVQKNAAAFGRRQQEIAAREQELDARAEKTAREEERLERLTDEYFRKLEAASGVSKREALRRLNDELVREAKLSSAALVKNVRDEAKAKAKRAAREVVLTAIQRTAAENTIENTVSVVTLQSDDMKGRIIGREGRNIRAFEAATGVEVIVDDTPEAVLLSAFDPVRREVARLSMVELLQDGRIHPGRIEEVVEQKQVELDEEIVLAGEEAALDLELPGLHPELVRLVGRMRYRASYGQNLLMHSKETARLASLMASELGLDARKARRAGLLHDIGKVVEENLEKPHALAGAELARRYGEHPDVVNAIGAHHDEIEMTTLIAPLVQAADAVSGARPGARREALENYVQRLKSLEAIADSFAGVERVYAIQAGRELRVIVTPDIVTDAVAEQLAIDIASRIERELQYPGHIRVTVIRETRAMSYAR